MDEETRVHKERLLAIYQENLREMEVRAAKFGLNTPLNIINEIKGHRRDIDELRILLSTNAEEVTFDKLLIGIEELQRAVREEGERAVKTYHEAFWDQGMLGFGLMAPFCGGVLVTIGLDYLYQQYLRGNIIVDQYNFVSMLIYVVGLSLTAYLTFKLGSRISKSKYDWFVYRMGYDPFSKQKGREKPD